MNKYSRCQGREFMMNGREADGGGSAEEERRPSTSPEKCESVGLGVDLYSQASKALSERSPFDSGEVLANTVPTLPTGLVSLLLRQSDSKKKHKRGTHSESKKSSKKGSTEKKGLKFWSKLEEFFRELTLQDIQRLYLLSSSICSLLNDSDSSCLKFPVLGNSNGNGNSCNDAIVKKVENGNAEYAPAGAEVVLDVDVSMSDAVVVEEKVEIENEKVQDVRIGSGSKDSLGVLEKGSLPVYSSQSCSSIEWVLGSRNRTLLTTTRPSKKRKLLGETAGLERLMVAQPCEGNSSLCHVCSMGDTGDQLNQLTVCKSCKVVVHQKCYGVQGETDGPWFCSWCKHKGGDQGGLVSGNDQPCVLCPKRGGALKPFKIAGSGNTGSVEFAHLFCSMWIPEVYIDDTRLMEPILCHGVKDIRGKLVCNLCKVKVGSCVRCSDGSCRTSFHPLCAREETNKLEIWGKFGCDDIELRGFCAKHSGNGNLADCAVSESNEQIHASGNNSLGTTIGPECLGNKVKKLKISCKNVGKLTTQMKLVEANSDNLSEQEREDKVFNDTISYSKVEQGSEDFLELSGLASEVSYGDVKLLYGINLGLVLKKLVDRGKVKLEQISAEIGISETSLASKLSDNQLGPEMYSKLLKWLKDHSYLDTSEKDWRAKLSCLIPSKVESKTDDQAAVLDGSNLDVSDVPVKSVPPRRRTVGNIRTLNEDKIMSSWNNNLCENALSSKERVEQEIMTPDRDHLSKESYLDDAEETMVISTGYEHLSSKPAPTHGNVLQNLHFSCNVGRDGAEEGTCSGKSSLLDFDQDTPSCSFVDMAGYFDLSVKPGVVSSVHPYIQKKLDEVQGWLIRRNPDSNGRVRWDSVPVERRLGDENKLSNSIDEDGGGELKVEDLHKAVEMGVCDLSPEDEVEGEIIFFQQQLLHNAVALKHQSDQLISKIIKTLPDEMDSVRKRRWDTVLVNQYTYELKEARKQGRKERRHKEAQALLAAATAAAAASSRVSSLRKDVGDDNCPPQENQLKVHNAKVRGSLSSLSIPRMKLSNPCSDGPKAVLDWYSDALQYASGTPKQLKVCDICRRSESLLNPILVCSSCKVPVHLNCYRSVKESTGPWYCELCEESHSSKVSKASFTDSNEMSNSNQECGLCGASKGAFRKSSNGQWVHAFCAEWVFDSTFRRGQVSPVAGMETVEKGNDTCSVCQRKYGVCIKCNFGNCQSTFHPSCARFDDYYMYTKYMGGGKMQHKAYCSKHSLEQREKAEIQKHGVEDLKIVKQHRVELEKLRLLCERIVKREKLKRELVLCNHDIFTSKRDSLAVSMLVRHPFSLHESSDSATTSLKGRVDGSRSCSDAMQRSDDITVDSALSTKKCFRISQSIENDQKTEDSSTSRHISTSKSTDRVSFAGKQIPIRAALASHKFSHSMENIVNSRKNIETFEKELVMTSDQASLKNRRLPKGYFYVPVDYLSNGKPVSRDTVEREDDLDDG